MNSHVNNDIQLEGKLTVDDIKAMNNVPMLTKFIQKGKIIVFNGGAGSHKTTFVLDSANKILEAGEKCSAVYWFDFDEGIGRAPLTSKLIEKYPDTLHIKMVNDSTDAKYVAEFINDILNVAVSEVVNVSSMMFVFDGLQGVFDKYGKDINKTSEAGEIMNKFTRLRAAGATVNIIHHNNKQDKDGYSSFRGSQVIQDKCDAMFNVSSTADSNIATIMLTALKFGGVGEIYKGMEVKTVYDYSKGYIEYEPNSDESGSTDYKKDVLDNDIIAYVSREDYKDTSKTALAKDIGKALEKGWNTIVKRLDNLESYGYIKYYKPNGAKNKMLVASTKENK